MEFLCMYSYFSFGSLLLFFCLDAKEKVTKEKIKAALFWLLQSGIPLKKKNSLSLKQLFLFNVPSHSLRFTPKKWGLHSTQHRFARLGGCFLSPCHVIQTTIGRKNLGEIKIHIHRKENILRTNKHIEKHHWRARKKNILRTHPPQRAKRCWVLRWRTGL